MWRFTDGITAIGLMCTSVNHAALTLGCTRSQQFLWAHWLTKELGTQGRNASLLLSVYGNQDV